MTATLECVAARVAHGLDLGRCRPADVLAGRAGRLVVALDTPAGDLVAKVGPVAAIAREAAATGALSRRLATMTGLPRLGVPAVLLHDAAPGLGADTGLLVTQRCPGVSLAERLRRGDMAAVHRAGEAVAALQRVPWEGPATRLAQHAADLLRPAPGAWDRLPTLAGAAREVLDAVLAVEDLEVPARWLHRDLHPRQLLDDGDRTWVLDWEHAAGGDPALDVGNFCGYLRARLEPGAAEAAVSAFRAGCTPGDDAGALRRATVFEAFTYLRLACKAARPQTADTAAVQRALARAGAVLEEVLSGERR